MGKNLRILLIDDNPDDRALVIHALQPDFPELQTIQIINDQDLTQALEARDSDLIVTDYQLPWTNGLAILRTVKAHWPECPVIMFTNTGNEAIAVEAMKAGLHDYILKSPEPLGRFSDAVRSALEQNQQRQVLVNAETHYRSLFDNVPVGLYQTSPGGWILDANQALAQMLGYPDPAALRAINVSDSYLNPDLRQEWQALIERLGVVKDFEIQVRRQDGVVIWVRDNACIVRDDSGRVLYYEGSLEDITERKQTGTEIRGRSQELIALNFIISVINESPDLRTVLASALKQIVNFLDVDGVECHLFDESQRLSWAAAHGLNREFIAGSQKFHFTLHQDIPGVTLASRMPLYVPDLPAESRYLRQELAQAAGYHCLLCIPIMAGETLLGTLTLYSRQPREFPWETQRLLLTVSGQLATAIQRARLLEAERQYTGDLARSNMLMTVLNHVAAKIETAPNPRGVMETLGKELEGLGIHCMVGLAEADSHSVNIHYISFDSKIVDLFERITGFKVHGFKIPGQRWATYTEVIERRNTMSVTISAERIMAVLPGLPKLLIEQIVKAVGLTAETQIIYLPLIVEDRVLGLLGLWGESLQETDIPTFSIFASQVATAMESAWLFAEVQRLATTDELTNLANRRHFFELAQRDFKRARRFGDPLSAIMLDIDHFKDINDTYGHKTGDQVLRAIAGRCAENVRDVDILGRYGGEEFVMLLTETELATAYQIAERLRRDIADQPIPIHGEPLHLTISLGVAEVTQNTPDLEALLDQADKAMYAAKQAGRNQVVIR